MKLSFARALPALSLVLGLSVVGCSSDQGDNTEESEDAVSRSIDLKKYSFVTVLIALEEDATAFDDVLRANDARTIEDGRTTLAGYTSEELEGGEFDPGARGDGSFGVMCGKDGIGMMSCAVTALVKTSEVETKETEDGLPLVTKVTLSGKLGYALSSVLPAVGPERIGARTVGYAPLDISCETTSGHVGGVPVATCSIPAGGFGATFPLKDMVDAGEMTATEARKMVKQFFPSGR